MKYSKRSSRHAGTTRALAVAAALGAAATGACTHYAGRALPGEAGCAALDSALAASGLRDGVAMRGKVTIDVNQYRVRGHYELTLSEAGDLTFDMNSTTLLGGHREDAVLSFYADTLRVLDRERGRFYQGGEVDRLVTEGAGAAIDLGELLRLATGRPPACARVSNVHRSPRGGGGMDVSGRLDGRDFSVRLERGRITRAVWPLPLGRGGHDETVVADYRWSHGALDGFTVLVPQRRWRVRLTGGAP